METEWAETDEGALDAEDRANALHRVKNLTKAETAFILDLAGRERQEIVREGKLLKVHTSLEDKGWLRITDVGFVDLEQSRIGFTLDGWDALCVLLDQRGE